MEQKGYIATGRDMAIIRGADPTKKDYSDVIDRVVLDRTKDTPDPEPVMRQEGVVFMTKGNFSSVIGQAKSRKTFLTTAIAGAYLSPDGHLGFEAPDISGPILWIDTEQADGHVARVDRRICRIAGLNPKANTNGLITCMLREYSPDDRKGIVEALITKYRPAICVIDGIADLIDTVNDEYASSSLITMMMQVTKKYNCHILAVLHLNPNSTKPRGHLGSEVLRKSETVLLVKKDGDTSKVIFERCRDIEAQDFNFFVDSTGIPQLSTNIKDNPKKEGALIKMFEKIMPPYPTTIKYNDLVISVCKYSKCKDRTAKKKITDAINKDLIHKNVLGVYHRSSPTIQQQTIDMALVNDDEMPF